MNENQYSTDFLGFLIQDIQDKEDVLPLLENNSDT